MAWKTAKGRKKRQGAFGRVARWTFRAFLLFLLLSVLWVLLYRFVPPPITFTQIGDVVSGRGLHRDWMSLDAMDRDVVRAAIAAEDSKFCAHSGFDEDAIAAAMRRNARGGKVIRGGSTISQQTAKNAFLWQGGGYVRKGIEAWFTLLIENLWGKRRIMEVYLNVAETGLGTYGVNAGAQRYFGHDAASMTSTEASRIAAVLPLPKKRGAVAPKGFTRRYGNSIASRMRIVARDGLDACVYAGIRGPDPADVAEPRRSPAPPKKTQTKPSPTFEPETAPGEDYEEKIEGPVDAAPATETEPMAQAEPPAP
jgi:monofunctional biosynthetic peptidoglycan transglycosylase